MVLKILLLYSLAVFVQADTECLPRDYGTGVVCVCNAEHCDTVGPVEQLESGKYVMYTSNEAGLRFKKQVGDTQPPSVQNRNTVSIDSSKTYQTIHGFGGAFTDSTGININSLNDLARNNLMRSYFSDEGIEYSIGRVPIGGTDFSTRAYTYLDTKEPDVELENFALAPEDFEYKIPLIQEAKQLRNDDMIFFASAWTAPLWMKTNNKYVGGELKTEMYQVWVDYFVKFFDLYKEENIEFWGLTTGNEPSLALFAWTQINTVGWLPWKQNRWIRRNLGPTIRKSQYSNLKLIVHDDQRILLPLLHLLFDDSEARNYIDGIGVHWYWDDFVPASWMSQIKRKYPEKFFIGTEASKGDRPWDEAVVLGSWKRGEAYAQDIILDLQNWATGWVDWNMALDEQGGPTYISNFIDSPIIVNATGQEFYKQPMFYAMGHFSKFIPRGSVVVDAPKEHNGLLVVALNRPDNGTVIVIVNRQERDIPITLSDSTGTITTDITARSFNTILYW